MYLLDFARLLPPQAPEANGTRTPYYQLLRAEYVSLKCPKPLCADAFSGWIKNAPLSREVCLCALVQAFVVLMCLCACVYTRSKRHMHSLLYSFLLLTTECVGAEVCAYVRVWKWNQTQVFKAHTHPSRLANFFTFFLPSTMKMCAPPPPRCFLSTYRYAIYKLKQGRVLRYAQSTSLL